MSVPNYPAYQLDRTKKKVKRKKAEFVVNLHFLRKSEIGHCEIFFHDDGKKCSNRCWDFSFSFLPMVLQCVDELHNIFKRTCFENTQKIRRDDYGFT